MACEENHRYDGKLNNLVDRQKGSWRHKCCGCAYERGYELGFKDSASFKLDDIALALPRSQAGTGRHKDAYQAFALGIYYGREARQKKSKRKQRKNNY